MLRLEEGARDSEDELDAAMPFVDGGVIGVLGPHSGSDGKKSGSVRFSRKFRAPRTEPTVLPVSRTVDRTIGSAQ
jgi:hypothetical protein